MTHNITSFQAQGHIQAHPEYPYRPMVRRQLLGPYVPHGSRTLYSCFLFLTASSFHCTPQE